MTSQQWYVSSIYPQPMVLQHYFGIVLLVTAASGDSKDRWKTVVDLDRPVQKVVLIELVKVRAARQVAERQVVQL